MAGRVALDAAELEAAVNFYLNNPDADCEARREFIRRECTYTDGLAGKRTAEFFLKTIQGG